MTGFNEYDKYDGLGLAELVRNKQVTPVELVEEAVARIDRYNPSLNAIVHKMYGQALETANSDLPGGPFQGVPFLLKDLMTFYKCEPLTTSSRFFHDKIPEFESVLV